MTRRGHFSGEIWELMNGLAVFRALVTMIDSKDIMRTFG